VVVAVVSSSAPFSQQGRLQPGDVIYTLNGTAVASVQELNTLAENIQGGSPSVLQIERQGMLMYLAFRFER
jgi:S1-C subfamily serine protease